MPKGFPTESGNFLTPVIKASGSPYAANAWDLVVVTSGAPFTVTLPVAPTAGDQIVVADGNGGAAANNITVNGNGKTINGAATLVITLNFAIVTLTYTGTTWTAPPSAAAPAVSTSSKLLAYLGWL